MILREQDIPDDMKGRPDDEVLALCVSSPAVFSILYDRYHDEFVRKAKKIVGEEYAEDLVQEAFVKIYMNAARFKKQEGASFKSWGYRILMNACFTYYKKQKRDREATMPLDEELAELLPNFRTNVDKEFTGDYVLSILSRMPSLLANVLKAYFIEGKPQKEIAEAEGVSVGVVKTRVHRAKKEFKKVAFSLM
ncbi:RNA polymerase sigma factor [Candidatus Parcubacteria bacterium]|nr:RNA polymerase sigma factor [Candidatus Parcubacteria bacterium]